MAEQQSHDIFWEGQPSYNNEQQYSVPLNYYEAPYDVSTLSILIPQPEIQYAPLPFIGNASDVSSTGWYTSGIEPSPRSEVSTPSPKVPFIDPNYLTSGVNRNGSPRNGSSRNGSPNSAANKRRQQNRNSQTAHRERQKKLVEDLRCEITEYSEYSQEMYQTLQSLMETTKMLVSTIDNALSRQPPMGRRSLERQRTDFDEARRSSTSTTTGRESRQRGK